MTLNKEDLIKKYNKEELKKYLNSVIDAEIKKSGEMDSDLIGECVDWLLELKGIEVEVSEDEIKNQVQTIIGKKYQKRKKRFFSFKISAAFVAAVFIAQIVSVRAFGVDLFDLTKDKILSLVGVEVQEDGISQSASWAREYATVEELETAEKIEILSPVWLPNDEKVVNVVYAYSYEKNKIHLSYSNNTTSLDINLQSAMSNTDGAEIYENEGILFYVFEEANVIYWEWNGDFYNLTFKYDIDEYAEDIIKNIK